MSSTQMGLARRGPSPDKLIRPMPPPPEKLPAQELPPAQEKLPPRVRPLPHESPPPQL
ncbi:MAG: hypothetical protein HC875_03855 [Anaerolineales bacterium]|nr:hypothetical protein [Anaerolineales bacterium]